MAKVLLSPKKPVAKKPAAAPPSAKPVDRAHKLPAVRAKEPAANTTKLTGLSLRQLLKATPPFIRSNADEVIVKALKTATTKGGQPGIRAKTLTYTKKVSARTLYDTTIVGKEKGIPVSKQKHVLVSCSCAWFWSHCEYALAHWGSAVIKYSNGDPATVTNPQNHPLLCKHLYKLAATVVTEGL